MTRMFFRSQYVPMNFSKRIYGATYRFQGEDAADETSFVPFDQGRSTRLFLFSKHQRYNKRGNALTRSKEEDLTTRLSLSSLRPVSFKLETINGHTPMLCSTTSTRWGKTKSFVKMAFLRAGREVIQSRVSALFSRLTITSAMASPSKKPNTLEAVPCKQSLNERRSKVG